MARNNNNKLKAFVRFDGSGRIISSSLIVQAFKPRVGNWQEIDAKECCNYTTTTTSTTLPLPSDKRLKENIVPTGNFRGEFTEYTWNWNAIAKDLNLDHYPTIGVMAQDVLEKKPEAVVLDTNIGYFRVNYNKI